MVNEVVSSGDWEQSESLVQHGPEEILLPGVTMKEVQELPTHFDPRF